MNDNLADLEPNIRSLNSREKCYVRFINTTDRIVDIMWIDFTGLYCRYRVISKGEYIDINTYKTHPWIVKDFMTKDMLHIDGSFVYHPKTTKEVILERYPDRPLPQNHEARIRAYIMLPMYSLRYACVLSLRNILYREQDVDQLCLPKQLSEDLKKAISKRNRECSMQVSCRALE
ncbi:von Hippel-Lindau disease tumor suppressor [Anthonomus grandis grandis]|uniref:von Hippel-Lindau disease tumor suppressor n=1 Tax=Anthonomus grandis grandis TaxID=2921223 RepID=UPI002165D592|nr:von Hippel-Lindau disease tumor suppressor [Anthonomus grandis grandis]